ncbi:MAG: glycosyltransferase family 4 protein [Desulfobacterales bacterium]|nr:glycosyltransferase family 4 protein [Desulfobacterales bacterium]
MLVKKLYLDKLDSEPLRICLLSYRSNPKCGGQGVYIKNLSRSLKDLGHYVEVISGPPLPNIDADIPLTELKSLDLYNPNNLFRTPDLYELMDLVNFIEWVGVSTMGFPEPYTFGIRAFRYLRKRLHHFDIVHDNQCLSYGIQSLSNYIPTIATIHHPITMDRQIDIRSVRSLWKKFKWVRWYSFIGMQKHVARKLHGLITVSEASKQDISREFKIASDKLHVVPNGITTELFYPIPEIKRQPGRIIVTNSAVTPLKGLYYLLQAIATIAKLRHIHLIVVGTLKKDSGIDRLIKQLHIGKYVTFTGYISHEEYVRQYALASIAVVPSVYEGFGLPVGEAMACGIPVICTTGGALPEVAGKCAFLVPPKDVNALTQAIMDLLSNPAYAETLGKCGYQRIVNHLTWEKAAINTVSYYRHVIRNFHEGTR